MQEITYEYSDELPLNLKEQLRSIISSVRDSLTGKSIIFSGIFLPWYLWTITFYPIPLLWWISFCVSFIITVPVIFNPRISLYIIGPCILLFNTLYFWLPWPSIKIIYIAAGGTCFGILVNYFINKKSFNSSHSLSFDFKIFFACVAASAFIAILRFFDWKCGGAWYELFNQLRVIPVLSEKERYISLRSLWVWSLAVSLYLILRRIVVRLKDIHIIFWSLQIVSIFIAAFGIYSYVAKNYMVGQYIFERRINATLSSPAVLADTFTAIFLIGIYLIRISKRITAKIFLFLALLMQLTAIFLSGCRTNFILISFYLLIQFIIFIIKYAKKIKWYYNVIIAVFSLLLFVGGIHGIAKMKKIKITKLPVIKRIIEFKTEYKHKKSIKKTLFKGRLDHWITASNMIKKYSFWGIGTGLFEQNYKRFHSKNDLFWYARTHCVPLRICAEGGFVSLVAFSIFILLVLIRLSYGFTKRARKKLPEWSKLTRLMFTIFLMMFISSLFTDIFYVNIESMIFLSLLSVCGAVGYSHIRKLFRQHFLKFDRKVETVENNLNDFFIGIGWEYLGFIRIKTILKYFIVIIIIFLIALGVIDSNRRRASILVNKQLIYGFLNHYKEEWYVISKKAAVSFIVKKSVFTFKYRPFNAKTLQVNQTLFVYINGVLSGKISLNSVLKKTIYCDVSNYKGNKITIEFDVDKTFVPLDEKWFVDTRKYGALITIPKQVSKYAIKEAEGYPVKWLSDADFK